MGATTGETWNMDDRRQRGGYVYVSLTKTKGSPDQAVEIATIAGEEMLPWLRQIEGFDG
jgi:hypothetical protein